MVLSARFERATCSLGGSRSIQLSYESRIIEPCIICTANAGFSTPQKSFRGAFFQALFRIQVDDATNKRKIGRERL